MIEQTATQGVSEAPAKKATPAPAKKAAPSYEDNPFDSSSDDVLIETLTMQSEGMAISLA